jgi:phospholipase/carboxylesterase
VVEAAGAAGEGAPVATRARRVLVALAVTLVACDDRTMPSARPRPPTFVERVVPPRQPAPGTPPLLVMLHGIGADENDLLSLADHVDPRFLVVSLRAPRPYHGGWAWFQIDWRPDGSVVPDVAQARATLADLVGWLGAAPARLGTDPQRVYLLGFSQGAMMSLGVLRAAPERLAGVVALSGLRVDELVVTPAAPDAMARVPVFVGHGTRDDVLPVANGRAIREALAPRVRDFTYREYAVAHGIGADEVADVATWLTAHLDAR